MPCDLQPAGVTRRPADNIATKGWFIGMMLAIAFLLLILIIVCIVKRNRGGKYAVHEREAAHGRTDFNEEQGFPEFAQPYVVHTHTIHTVLPLCIDLQVPF